MNEHALSACYEDAVAALEGLGVTWALIGAFAAIEYRIDTRATTDVDFLVADGTRLAQALTDRGFDVSQERDADGRAYFIRGRRGGISAEFLVAETSYQFEALRRAEDHVITAEDVVIHKLIAWRERDRDDIASILANPDVALDEAYVEHWAELWEVTDRWHRARGPSGHESQA